MRCGLGGLEHEGHDDLHSVTTHHPGIEERTLVRSRMLLGEMLINNQNA